jgi:hypothetical protein
MLRGDEAQVTTDPRQEQSGGLGSRLASPLFRVLATALFLVAVGGIAIAVGATTPSSSKKANGCVRTFSSHFCRGPTGPRGATGPKGAKGKKGAGGPAGATGTTGQAGPTGAGGTGTPGTIGATGPAGVTGSAGVTGPTGTPGATGPTGTLASAYGEEHYTGVFPPSPQTVVPGFPVRFDQFDASQDISLTPQGATIQSDGTYELEVTLASTGGVTFSYSVNGAQQGEAAQGATTTRIITLHAGDFVQVVNGGSGVASVAPGATLQLIRIG